MMLFIKKTGKKKPASRILAIFIMLGCTCHGLTAQSGRQVRDPNIILILTDDQGIGDIGYLGNPLAEYLKGKNYTTAIFGKWYLGDNYPFRPGDQGFEQSLIFDVGGLAQPGDVANFSRKDTETILL